MVSGWFYGGLGVNVSRVGVDGMLLLLVVSCSLGSFSTGELYAGTYTCGSPAWLFLHIHDASEQRVNAVFQFLYPSSTQNGAYEVHGKYRDAVSPTRRAVQFEPGVWVAAAGKVVRVGLLGILSEDGDTFAGEVLHSSCGSFELARVSVDELIPPESTVNIGALSAEDAQPSTLKLTTGSSELGVAHATTADGTGAADDAARRESRPTLQMLINGAAGLIEEARLRRRTRAQSMSTRAAAPAAPAPLPSLPEQLTIERAALVGPVPVEVSVASALVAEEVEKLQVLEPALRQLIDAREFSDAYKLFAGVGNKAVQHAVARRIVNSLAATQQALGAGANDELVEHDALRTLALFVSQLPAAGRALVAVFKEAGMELAVHHMDDQKRALAAVETRESPVTRPPAERLSARHALERRIRVAEMQLELAVNRSGSADADARLAAAELVHSTHEDAEAALLAITQLHPEWAWAWRRLAALRRERPGGVADAQSVDWLRRATRLAPYDVFAWMELGDTLRAGNDARGALHAYNEAKSIHPTLPALRRLQQWLTAVEAQAKSGGGKKAKKDT